jgi:hypothetical protein
VSDGLAKRWDFDDGDAEGKVGKAESFDGKATWVDGGPLQLKDAIAIAAWIRPASFRPSGGASYIVSKGEWNEAYRFGLSAGKLRMATGAQFAQTPKPLAVGKWQHVAGTFDGSAIRICVEGKEANGSASPASGDVATGVEGGVAWLTRRADPAPATERWTVAAGTRVLGAEVTAGGGEGQRLAAPTGQAGHRRHCHPERPGCEGPSRRGVEPRCGPHGRRRDGSRRAAPGPVARLLVALLRRDR